MVLLALELFAGVLGVSDSQLTLIVAAAGLAFGSLPLAFLVGAAAHARRRAGAGQRAGRALPRHPTPGGLRDAARRCPRRPVARARLLASGARPRGLPLDRPPRAIRRAARARRCRAVTEVERDGVARRRDHPRRARSADAARARARRRRRGRPGAGERAPGRRAAGALRRAADLARTARRGRPRRAPSPGARPPRRRPAAPGRALAAARRSPRSKIQGEPDQADAAARRGAATSSSTALAELRELARGIHPAVLADHGLDAALDALAEPRPAAGRVSIATPSRAPARAGRGGRLLRRRRGAHQRRQVRRRRARERAASSASTATRSSRSPTTASAAPIRTRGTGLRGLADRVAALDGRLERRTRPAGGHHGEGGDPMRVVVADDSVLLREGDRQAARGGRLRGRRPGRRRRGPRCARSAPTSPTSPSSTCACRRRTPTTGLRAAIEIRAKQPETGVLVLSQYVEEPTRSSCSSDNAEGVGYLLKDRVGDVEPLHSTPCGASAEGGSALDPEVVSHLLGRSAPGRPALIAHPREREVLGHMAEGRSNHAIADGAGRHRARGREARHESSSRSSAMPAAEDHRRVLAVLRT